MKGVINRRSIASWAYLGATTIGGLAMLAAASRFLTTEYAGLWFTIQVTGAFLLLVDFGGGYVMVREVAHSVGTKSGDSHFAAVTDIAFSAADRAVIRRVTAANLAACFTLAASFLVYFLFVAPVYARSETLIAAALFYGSVAANAISLPKRSYLEGIGLLHVERFTAAACYLLASLLVAAAAWFTHSLIAMGAGMLIGMVANVIALNVIERRLARNATREGLIRHSFREIARTGLGFLWISAGASATKSSFAPIVTAFLGSATLAPFFFANRVTATLANTLGILVLSERAVFMRLFAQPTMEPARRHLKTFVLICGPISLVAGAGVILLGPWVTRLVIGPHYVLPQIIYIILGLDLACNVVSGAFGNVVMASGRNPFKASVFLAGVFTVALLFWMVPRYGVLGAAFAPFLAGCLTGYWYNIYWAFHLLYRTENPAPPVPADG